MRIFPDGQVTVSSSLVTLDNINKKEPVSRSIIVVPWNLKTRGEPVLSTEDKNAHERMVAVIQVIADF